MVGIGDADEVRLLGDLHADSWIALYRLNDRLVGALSLNRPGKIMKYRALISRRTTWDEALEFAESGSGKGPSSGSKTHT